MDIGEHAAVLVIVADLNSAQFPLGEHYIFPGLAQTPFISERLKYRSARERKLTDILTVDRILELQFRYATNKFREAAGKSLPSGFAFTEAKDCTPLIDLRIFQKQTDNLRTMFDNTASVALDSLRQELEPLADVEYKVTVPGTH